VFHNACFCFFLLFVVVVVFEDEKLLPKLVAKEHSNLRVERSLLHVVCWHSWMLDETERSPDPIFNNLRGPTLLSDDQEVREVTRTHYNGKC